MIKRRELISQLYIQIRLLDPYAIFSNRTPQVYANPFRIPNFGIVPWALTVILSIIGAGKAPFKALGLLTDLQYSRYPNRVCLWLGKQYAPVYRLHRLSANRLQDIAR